MSAHMTTQERIINYAQSLSPGSEVTVTEVCKDIGGKSVCSRSVANTFRWMEDTMEFIPHYTKTGKWRRK